MCIASKWLNKCSLISLKDCCEERWKMNSPQWDKDSHCQNFSLCYTSIHYRFPMEQPLKQGKAPESINAAISFPSLRMLLLLHLACGLGLALAFWVAVEYCSLTLIHSPGQTLFVLWVGKPPQFLEPRLLNLWGNFFLLLWFHAGCGCSCCELCL